MKKLSSNVSCFNAKRICFYTILLLVVVSISSCKKEDKEEPKPELSQREAAIEDYKKNFLASEISSDELNWTGDAKNCNAGTISQIVHDRFVQRVNYLRRATGLSDNLTSDPEFSKKCQEAALMSHANGDIEHFPPKNWKCYSENGAFACGKSNLAYGYSSPSNALLGFMRDGNQIDPGHRRWILYSALGNIGIGCAEKATVMGVIDTKGGQTSDFPVFTSWPPKGYVMAPLVYGNWHFSIPGRSADFSKAKVEMFNNKGEMLELSTVQPLENGYGDNAIGWIPKNIDTKSNEDTIIKVKVSNVINNGLVTSYEYTVTIVTTF